MEIKTIKTPEYYPNSKKELGFTITKYVGDRDIGHTFKDFDFNKFQTYNYLEDIKFFKTQKGAEKWIENSWINKKTISLGEFLGEYNK